MPPEPSAPLVQIAAADATPSAPAAAAAPAVHGVEAPVDGTPVAYHGTGEAVEKRCLGFIQVGAFVEPERAVRLAKELDAATVLPVSADMPTVDRYARVRLGPLGTSEQAEAALRWLQQSGHANAFFVAPDAASSVAC
jgi:cell division septation protein DedD